MPAPRDRPAVAAAMLLLTAGFALAQDLERDLPWRRLDPGPSPAECVDQGTGLLANGCYWEAARAFRELVKHDETKPIGHLGLALAVRSQPNRAARLAWEAIARRGVATPGQLAVLDAYQRYFGVTKLPEFVDPKFSKPPDHGRSKALIEELRGIDTTLARSFLAVEVKHAQPLPVFQGDDKGAVLESHNAYLQQHRAMPFMIPGYRTVLEQHLAEDPDREQALARLPRHPHFGSRNEKPVDAFHRAKAGERWVPPRAPGFDLRRGLGGRGKFADFEGKPTLVVFFLGFG